MQAAELLSRGGFSGADLERARDLLLRAPVAEGGAGFISAVSRLSESHQLEEPSWWSEPAGDLDGDGVGDLLTLTYHWNEERLEMTARRGSTAAALWSLEVPFTSYLRALDLDGDGRSEVVIAHFEPRAPRPGTLKSERWDWSLTVLDGADGSIRWRSTYSGRVTYASPGVGVVRVADFPTKIEVIDDASGDGSSDILVGLLTYTDATVGGPSVAGGGSFEALVLEGSDGSAVGSTRFRDIQGLAIPRGVPDLSGDDLADIVGMRLDGDGDRLIAAHTADGTPIWSSPVDRPRGHPAVREIFAVEGAAGPMVGFVEWNGAYLDPAWTIDVWSADGSAMWGRSTYGFPFYWEAGDVDGDGFGDVGSADWYYDADGETLVVAMTSMTSGGEIWSIARTARSIETHGSAWLNVCPCTADLDGDGVADPSIGVVSTVPDSATEIESSAIVGVDGSILWERFDTDLTGPPIVLFADLDGDGGADLGRFERPGWQSDRASLTFEAHDGATANPMWRHTWLGVSPDTSTWATGADLIAASNAEVIVHLERWDERFSRRIITEYGVGPSGVIWTLGGA